MRYTYVRVHHKLYNFEIRNIKINDAMAIKAGGHGQLRKLAA
jgi:hypothetical protein